MKQLRYAYAIYAQALRLPNHFELPQTKRLLSKAVEKFTKAPLQHVPSFHEEIHMLFDYLDASWVPFNEMSEKMLRDRSILLTALCLMARPSDIAKFSFFRTWVVFQNGQTEIDFAVEIQIIASKTDQKRQGRKLRIYSVDKIQRCMVRHLEAYLLSTKHKEHVYRSQQTSHVAQDERQDSDIDKGVPTFLSVTNDVKGLMPDSISAIITSFLQEAGIDESLGKGKITAKSIRPTAATQAFTQGVSLADILDTGGWSVNSADLLRRYYLRPSIRHNISDCLLGTNSNLPAAEIPQ